MAPVEIRRSTPDDDLALLAIFRSAVRQVASRDYSPDQIAAWAPLNHDLPTWKARRASRPTWLAEVSRQGAGFTDLDTDGHLDMLFVHADFQGQGVATMLVATVEAAARELALPRIFTEASITARPFFERRGFAVIEQQTVHLRGQDFVNFRMEKLLAVL